MTVDSDLRQAKQPVSGALAGPYGHPFHPILVTVPIGAWVCSLVFDIASHIVDRPGSLTEGSEWLIGIGIVGALAAATIGFLDLVVIPARTPAFRTALVHMSLNLMVSGIHRQLRVAPWRIQRWRHRRRRPIRAVGAQYCGPGGVWVLGRQARLPLRRASSPRGRPS